MRLNNYLGEPIKVKDVLTAYDISKTYQKQAFLALARALNLEVYLKNNKIFLYNDKSYTLPKVPTRNQY